MVLCRLGWPRGTCPCRVSGKTLAEITAMRCSPCVARAMLAQRATIYSVLYENGHLSVYRFIGVWQQESGKGPRLANGAAKLRTRPNLSYPPPLESIAGAARSVGLPSPHKPVRGRIRCGWRTGGVSVSQIYCAPFPCIGQPASCRPSPKI